jgi:uncharacterized protein
VTGAILNAAAIVAGGLVGLERRGRPLTVQSQSFYKLGLGLFTVYFGMRLVWLSLGGSFPQVSKQVVIAVLAVAIGKPLGRLLHLQKASNQLGQYARTLIEQARPNDPRRFGNGLNVCAILFCAAPLGILGAVHDGLSGYFYPLAVKGVMDGLAMMGFVLMFGSGAMLSALPVFVFQAAITLACHLYAAPFLLKHDLLDSVNAVGGLVICTVALVIFEFKKVALADYLPSLAVAPLLTWFWK